MELEISKITERGQVTIPQEFREELRLKGGEKILFIRENGSLILKPMKNIKAKSIERLREDFIDAQIAEKRLKEMEEGKVIRQTADEFLKDLEKWMKE